MAYRPAIPPSIAAAIPGYFDGLLQAHAHGAWGRQVHLGLWPTPPDAADLQRPGAYAAAMARLDERLLDLAELQDGQDVLDVGCGLGGTLQAIDARHRRMRLCGLNIDPRQLAACATLSPRHGNTMHWLLAEATALTLADAAIDRLFCVEAMFHFPSRSAFFAEAARVLRPGGVLVASDIVIRGATAGEAEAILSGFGPWPDLQARATAEDPAQRLAQAGLVPDCDLDLSAETAPSHHFTAGGSADSRDPVARACQALRALHERGALRYRLLRARRAPAQG